MTISLLIKKISMHLLSKVPFIFAKHLEYIIKIFYIISRVFFWAVNNLANKIFNNQAVFSFNFPPVEQAVNFKKFKIFNIIVNKYKKKLIKAKLPKKISK